MKPGWTEVALGEICTFRYGKALAANVRSGSGSPVFGSSGQVGLHDEALTDSPTIVIGRKGSFGEVHWSEEPCWPIDTTYFVDQESTTTDLRWLKHRLAGLGLNRLNRAAAVPGLNRDDAYRQRLMLPPLEEQKRIAAILDMADALRDKRRAAIAHLDSLTQAIFHNMFGDPVTNPLGWSEGKALGDVADVRSGITKGRRTSLATRPVPYLAVSNVKDRRLDLGTLKSIEASEDEIARYRLERGDILLTEGGDPDKLGRGTLWNGELTEAIHQNHIFRARVHTDEVTPLFLSWLLSSARGKRYFLRAAKKTTGIASINLTQLKAFPLLLPPVRLQREFAIRVARVDRHCERVDAAASQDGALCASLRGRAFRGEL